MIEEIKKEIDKKYQENNRPIIASQRCQFAKTNETIGESKARSKGFLSGLLVAKNIIGKYKEQENKLQSKLDLTNIKLKEIKEYLLAIGDDPDADMYLELKEYDFYKKILSIIGDDK